MSDEAITLWANIDGTEFRTMNGMKFQEPFKALPIDKYAALLASRDAFQAERDAARNDVFMWKGATDAVVIERDAALARATLAEARVEELRGALAPVLEEARKAMACDLDTEDVNPDWTLSLSLSVAEIRALVAPLSRAKAGGA